jgi:hypothetical protein
MTNNRLELKEIYVGEYAESFTSEPVNLDTSIGFSVVFKKTDISLTNKTFTTVSLNAFTSSAHGYKTGLKVRFTTSGALPTGLALATDYYLIRISDDTLMVASSMQNASDGDYLSISGGSGTHTIAVQTFTPVYLKLEASIDGDLWVNIPDATYEIRDEVQMIEHETAFYHYVRAIIDLSDGQYDFNSKMLVKGF